MKKVLGLVVSERKLGNTELLLKEIMGSVPEPCRRELIRLTELKIEPCRACYRCLQPDLRCRQEDDFNFVMDRILEADALLIGVPVYLLGPHSYYKLLTDRLLGSHNYSRHTRGKPCAVIIPYGLPGWEGYARSASLVFPRLLDLKIVDCWQVPAALPAEGLLSQKNRDYARELGRSLFERPEYAKGPRECPLCGSDLFRLLPGGGIECPICAARGVLGAGSQVDFSQADHCRFSEKAMTEHFDGWLKEMKAKFLAEKDRLKEVQQPYKELDWWVKPGK